MSSESSLVLPEFAFHIRPEFFYLLIYGNFFSDLGSGGRKKILKKSSENDQLTGHFQSFFFFFFFFFFQYFESFFFLISQETVKLEICKPTGCIKSLNILSFS